MLKQLIYLVLPIMLMSCSPREQKPNQGFQPQARQQEEVPEYYSAKGYKVTRVVDGDTFIINMDGSVARIRLIGVDTPESVHPNKEVEAYGLEASAFLKQLLDGQSVNLKYDQANAATNHRDKYKRLLAYAYRSSDGLFINAEIIKQGYGHAYTVFPFEEAQNFLQYEREARAAQRGLWQDEPVSQESPAQSKLVYVNSSSGKYHRQNCRYVSTNSLTMSLAEARQKGYTACKICKP